MGYKHHTGERLLLYLLQWFFGSENYCCCSFYKIFRSSVVGQLIGSGKLYWCIWGNTLSGPMCGAVCWNTCVAIRISVFYKFIFPMILYIIGVFFSIVCIALHPNLFMPVHWQLQILLIFQILIPLLECEFLSVNIERFINRNFLKADISFRGLLIFNTVFRQWSRKWP